MYLAEDGGGVWVSRVRTVWWSFLTEDKDMGEPIRTRAVGVNEFDVSHSGGKTPIQMVIGHS